MGRAYSQDLRERVMAAVDSGTGAYAAAFVFRVSVSHIYKLLGRRKRTGEAAPPSKQSHRFMIKRFIDLSDEIE